jgi:PIN domain nuclease of toxin-antitoxin system
LEERGFEFLAIHYEHAAHVASLPLHHRDPFDRLLVAQAKLEGMTMVSHDGGLDAYGIPRLW